MSLRKVIGIFLSLFVLAGCSLFDPTEVINPNLKEKDILKNINTMPLWLSGMERQLALTYNSIVPVAEIASDNYINTQTYYNQAFDKPEFNIADADIDIMLTRISSLRESAIYGLNTVKAADASTTPNQEAELYFYKALSHILLGEYFVSAPVAAGGPAVAANVQLNQAITDLNQAIALSSDTQKEIGYQILLARAYHRLGDKVNAILYANNAISASTNYVRYAKYDGVSATTPDQSNAMQDALFDRGSFDDLQPLPRLDFLDPKYYAISASQDSDISIIKIEEAYMILAEAQLADNMHNNALATLQNLLTIVHGRPKATFSDGVEGRTQDAPGSRPDKSTVRVAASATDPLLSGLVLDRQAATVTVPIISGSSIIVNNVTNANYPDILSALQLLYLIRQEVFMAEGRRLVDLGLRLPVSQSEIVGNVNINPGDPSTIGRIPAFIPPDKEMDTFNYDATSETTVIMHNMNKVLITNRLSAEVIPFF